MKQSLSLSLYIYIYRSIYPPIYLCLSMGQDGRAPSWGAVGILRGLRRTTLADQYVCMYYIYTHVYSVSYGYSYVLLYPYHMISYSRVSYEKSAELTSFLHFRDHTTGDS